MDQLKSTVLDLAYELQSSKIELILAGGYGLFLKQQSLHQTRTKTLLPAEAWPEARATNDLDFLLRPEIVTTSATMKTIREALERLGFEPISSAKYYQFVKTVAPGKSVKVDLHAGPLGELADSARVRIQSRRVKPKPSVELHAHFTEEALAYDVDPLYVNLSGERSSGETYDAVIQVPQGFTYLLMKLFAFRDQRDDTNKGLAQHHALDLYRIVAMLTEPEFNVVVRLAGQHRQTDVVREARQIVVEQFASERSLGCLRIREHPLFHERMEIETFIEVVSELFVT